MTFVSALLILVFAQEGFATEWYERTNAFCSKDDWGSELGTVPPLGTVDYTRRDVTACKNECSNDPNCAGVAMFGADHCVTCTLNQVTQDQTWWRSGWKLYTKPSIDCAGWQGSHSLSDARKRCEAQVVYAPDTCNCELQSHSCWNGEWSEWQGNLAWTWRACNVLEQPAADYKWEWFGCGLMDWLLSCDEGAQFFNMHCPQAGTPSLLTGSLEERQLECYEFCNALPGYNYFVLNDNMKCGCTKDEPRIGLDWTIDTCNGGVFGGQQTTHHVVFRMKPKSIAPTPLPTPVPTSEPTLIPTSAPTQLPTSNPTRVPTPLPTPVPTSEPTLIPTSAPTQLPTSNPTLVPTQFPTSEPTLSPTKGVFDDILASDCVEIINWYKANRKWLTWIDIQDHMLVQYWTDVSIYATFKEAKRDFVDHCDNL